jgi:hypothetical protein
MIDEGASVDFEEFRPGDPYDIDRPEGWSAQYRDRTAVYENDRGDHRIRIVEFSKGLSLYWWVDVYVGEEGWHRQEVGLGDSYTDPEAAAAAVESYLDVVGESDGRDGATGGERPPSSGGRPDRESVAARRHAPGPDGWTLDDARPETAASDSTSSDERGSGPDTDATE